MTTPQPTDIVRDLFDAYAAGDVRRAVALVHEDIVAISVADGREYRGVDEVRAYLLAQPGSRRRVELAAHRIWADGDDVLVHGRIRVLHGGSMVDSPAAWRFTLREGRVSGMAPADPATAPSAA